ncbi:hypothetical protein QVD17_21086 [Tagetes erecta]|uniref:Uncharacterized protein n=1 Tax=Tagetes erecta TaxID=13708 RepID=A0AAD8NYS6_TARER|nr:hypothetical protein QVD17_21086 [Tagetes erecta]
MYSSTGPSQYAATGVPAQPVIVTAPRQWSTGLCDCCLDCSSCCLTCWCPCISFGRIAEIVNKGTTSCCVHGCLYTILCLTGCQCIYSCMYRSTLRRQYLLPDQPCNDCCVHCCCGYCALCQEYRELKHRGFEPSLGWQGNLLRRNQGVVMPPAGPSEMKR